MSRYERWLRPLLFLLPPETAHRLGLSLLSIAWPWRLTDPSPETRDARLETTVGGLRQANPLGLAAGFDKDAQALPGLSRLGFGSITIGAVTLHPRTGNARPRMKRQVSERALLHAMGLPSRGLAEVVDNLRRYRHGRPAGAPPIIANIGGFDEREVLTCLEALEPLVDATELNLTCPNVGDADEVGTDRGWESTLRTVAERRTRPAYVKLPPRSSDAAWQRGLDMTHVAGRLGFDGVTLGGNLRVRGAALSREEVSLSGAPCFAHTLGLVAELRRSAGDRIAIRVAGGAGSGGDALALLQAGADAVSLYTAFLYRGPGIASAMSRELLAAMNGQGHGSIRELRSTAAARLPERAAPRGEGRCELG